MNIGVLIGSLVFDQVVDVDTDFASHRLHVVNPNHHASGVHIINDSTACCGYNRTGVNC